MKTLYAILPWLALAIGSHAQTSLPLWENPWQQTDAPRLPHRAAEQGRNDCIFDLNVDLQASAGDSTFYSASIPDEAEELVCLDCASAQLGTADERDRTSLYYIGSATTFGYDTLHVAICTGNMTTCRDTQQLVILSRRADRSYFPPTEELISRETINLEADTSLLEAPLFCTDLLDCGDEYEGTQSLFYFQDYTFEDYRFVYRADRFGGVDSVCLVACDAVGICDTFRYSFRINVPSIGLPFFEDFSEETTHTDSSYWLDNRVYINRHIAQQPPSIGVATFDGLDAGGRPYAGGYGRADHLTSTYIDLTGGGPDPVLTFYAQPRGLGDRPEREDSLMVEFRLPNGDWQSRNSIPGLFASTPDTQVQPFQFYAIPVPANFQHDRFQFRFVNYADRSGLRDVWHVDYVRLDRIQVDTTFEDIAFTNPPLPMLAPYSSMPWRHFSVAPSEELRDSIQVGIWNHGVEAENADPSTFSVVELGSGYSALSGTTTLFNGTEINIPNGGPVVRSYELMGSDGFPNIWSDYVGNLNSAPFPDQANLRFRTRYTLVNTGQVSGPGYEDVMRNDTADHITPFANYFAYDDGTAESAVITGANNRVALRFRAKVADTLQAIRVNLPRLNANYTGQQFALEVYIGTLDNEPEFTMTVDPAFPSMFTDTIQGFTDYPLLDQAGNDATLELPVGDFYVGWRQINPCSANQCIGIGFDRNNPQVSDETFVDDGVGWAPLPAFLRGALMIRPIVGSERPGATHTDEVSAFAEITLYPNPARHSVQFHLPEGNFDDYQFRMYDATGRLVLQGPLTPTVATNALATGIYWVELRHTHEPLLVRKKLIIQH